MQGLNNSHIPLDYSSLTTVQKDDLSIEDIESLKAKMFVVQQRPVGISVSSGEDDRNVVLRSLMVFLNKDGSNVTILVDQSETCDDAISKAVLNEMQVGQIIDFTIVERHKPECLYLVCLAKTKLFVFDCKTLLTRRDEPKVRYLRSFDLAGVEYSAVHSA